MHDTIVIGMEDWEGVWRRMQPVTAGFARRHPANTVLFVGLPVDISHAVRTGTVHLLRSAAPRLQLRRAAGFDNLYLLNALKLLPDTLPAGRWLNQAIARGQIRSAARRIGMTNPVLYVNPHYAEHMAGRMGECALVYDIGDDWASLPQSEVDRKRVMREDRALCEKADAVIVVSDVLYRLKRSIAPRLTLIPNGVDVDRYHGIAAGALSAHPDTAAWKHPVVGYTGTIHKDRVDLELISSVAKLMPSATFVFAGPIQLNESHRRKLMNFGNVVLAGEYPFLDIPSIMAAFDVCMAPHLITPFTMSLSPLKLYEYLASGLPIVSTPVSGFKDYPGAVYLAATPTDFACAIHAALGEPATAAAARREIAREHSWACRLEEIFDVVEQCIVDKGAVRQCP